MEIRVDKEKSDGDRKQKKINIKSFEKRETEKMETREKSD